MTTAPNSPETIPLAEQAPSMNDLFAPPTEQWQRLSPRYLTAKLLGTAIGAVIVGGGASVAAFLLLPGPWPWVVLGAMVAWFGWLALRAPRVFRRWGYAEREHDVYLTHGLWIRTLTCVPYGRMQMVEVSSGPIDRLFGLASVEMVTSSTSGTVTIPGLDKDAAAALRDRLISRGEQQQAGI